MKKLSGNRDIRTPEAFKSVPPRGALHGRTLGRHRGLLEDPLVRPWWEARSLRSRLAADQALRQLGLLLEQLKLSPKELLDAIRSRPERIRDQLVRFASGLKSEGRLDSYVYNLLQGLKSFVKFHRVPFDAYPSLLRAKGASLMAERVPTPEELGRVLDRLSVRGKVVALLMAHSGVRPGVIGAYQGENGLRLSDLPELEFARRIAFREAPFVLRVPANLSKTRQAYTTFGSSQLASAIITYLEERRERGEKLSPSSPLIGANPSRGIAVVAKERATYVRGFLSTKQVVSELRPALASARPEDVHRAVAGREVEAWRPYVLRAYCSTRLVLAEGSGKMTRDLREAMMGHDLGVAGRYHLGKPWGTELLQEARSSYRRAEPFLSTIVSARPEDLYADMRRAFLLDLGFSAEEVQQVDLSNLGPEQYQELVTMKRNQLVGGSGRGAMHPPRPTQRVVDESEVDQWVAQGWTVLTQLTGNRRVVLNPPPS